MINKRLIKLVFCLGCLFLTSCASTQIKNMETMGNFAPEEDEARQWKRAEELQEILNKSGFIYEDEQLTRYTNEVLHRIVGELEKNNNVKLRVYILKDPLFNAMCSPNGTIYVHSSLLANIDNEAQLATILGHEATHFFHRHSLKQFRSFINKTAFLSFWQVTFAGVSGDAANLVRLFGEYCVVGSYYGYSRDLEREADKGAFELMKNAGYDYLETKKVFDNLYEVTKDEKVEIPYFYQEHPRTKERIKSYKLFIKELSKTEKDKEKVRGITGEDIYNKMIKNVLLDNAELEIKRNSLKLARKQIEKYNKLYPEDFLGIYAMGNLYFLEGKKEEAEKELKHAIELNPGYEKSHKTLGLLYYKKGERQKANAEFMEYLLLKPNADDADYIRRYLDEKI